MLLACLLVLTASARAADPPYKLAGIDTTASPSVIVGGSITDSAVLRGGVNRTGTVTFALYGVSDPACAGSPVFTSTASVVALTSSAISVSTAFSPTEAGTYKWIATYDGDANNARASGSCGDPGESVVVTPAGTPPPTPPPVSTTTSTVTLQPTEAGRKCDPAKMADALVKAIIAALTGAPGSAFKATCSASVRIVLRAKEIRPGDRGFPRHDGFTTMANTLTHPSSIGQIAFSFNSDGLALRRYAAGVRASLTAFAIVHVHAVNVVRATESIGVFILR